MSLSRAREDAYEKFDEELDISYHIRIAMVGDAGAGKTSLLLRYTDRNGSRTPSDHNIDVRTKMLIRNGRRIKLEIKDTAGLERYRSLTRSHYSAITGALLVFDLTNEMSFQHLTYWHEELYKNADKLVQAILVGTHCQNENREVAEDSIRRLAEHFDMPYVEVCSQANSNVDYCFETLVDRIIEKHSERVNVQKSERIQLRDESDTSRSFSRCCTIIHPKESG
ncbi:ras-like GTP-binding protein RYL1 [Acanthaster planci]|uniref:Ras-like GTP-binding protein RYL1 n=1 Tax=Acanthaster planci TaxID=133434 RepID=A0A8B7XYA5_ACAPL|nr:ras-like GTP-binding protein RYL1 [Acanthaster planci]